VCVRAQLQVVAEAGALLPLKRVCP
jgi:hypothetical protein